MKPRHVGAMCTAAILAAALVGPVRVTAQGQTFKAPTPSCTDSIAFVVSPSLRDLARTARGPEVSDPDAGFVDPRRDRGPAQSQAVILLSNFGREYADLCHQQRGNFSSYVTYREKLWVSLARAMKPLLPKISGAMLERVWMKNRPVIHRKKSERDVL